MRRRDLLLGAVAAASGRPRVREAAALLDAAARSGEVASAVLHVSDRGQPFTQAFGAARPETPFLLASITKPMTAAAVMSLVEEGRLGLDDPVHRHLPAFAGEDRRAVTIRQLLNHTSGLPDMLPDNIELRRRHAPLSAFVEGSCTTPLLFAPGTAVRYQSMGILLAAAIAQRVADLPFRELLRRRLLAPLGMEATSLGLGGRSIEQTARCQVADEPWGWNSPYWRDLGAPWGGAHGTAADLARLLRYFARPTRGGPLRPETVRLMTSAHAPLPAAPGAEPPRDRYGLGWRLGLGDRAGSDHVFGHSGATGVMCWIDPARDLTFVLLTTKPAAESGHLLWKVSDLVTGRSAR